MRREEIEKLLGGYATGTLTEQERSALFEAALSDQGLFDALMREQALAEVLADPRCRRQIAAALEESPSFAARLLAWMRRPQAWALAASTAAVVVLATAVIRVGVPVPAPKIELAAMKEEAPAAAPLPRRIAAPESAAKPAGQAAPLRPAQPPPLPPERRAAAEVPPPPELEAAAQPATPPQILGATAGMPAPPPAEAQRVILARPAAESVRSAFRDAEPRRSDLLMSTAARNAPPPGFGLRYSVEGRRLNLEATQSGHLYVVGARGLLFTTPLSPGKPYSFEAGPEETGVSLIFSRLADPGPPDTLLARAKSRPERRLLATQKADKTNLVTDPRGAVVVVEVPLPK